MGVSNKRDNENRHGRESDEAATKPKSEADKRLMVERILGIGRECAGLPVFDKRKPEEMLYDQHGLPN